MTISRQLQFEKLDEEIFQHMLNESRKLVKFITTVSDKPIVVNFSGGKDSMAMASLVKEITNNVVCVYMATGIEFPEATEFAMTSAQKLGMDLIITTPQDHLGGLFDRLPNFGWPTVRKTWCNRDLKVRPQLKVLRREFGKGTYYKMVGVRKYESSRRKKVHRENKTLVIDYNTGHDYLVYPILQWTSADVQRYLRLKGLPTSGLYRKYGVSGCYWCPFYQPRIYQAILRDYPTLYDEFIEWEIRLNSPSVNNHVWLRDLRP
jgi:3'-phosphoadenosine 5'-phosphosulfate sulfotransferase (PAPS reductase)/FAD synthetase